jgi:hypothetical protein
MTLRKAPADPFGPAPSPLGQALTAVRREYLPEPNEWVHPARAGRDVATQQRDDGAQECETFTPAQSRELVMGAQPERW